MHLTSSNLSSTNQHLQASPQVAYINISDLQSATWHRTQNIKPLIAEIVAETTSHYIAHLAQTFLQLYSTSWEYHDYQENIQCFRELLGKTEPNRRQSIALYIPKETCKLISPFQKVGEAYLIWSGKWSRWFDWNVYLYPQMLTTYGLTLEYVQTSLIYDPSIWLDLQGFRLNFINTGINALLKVYPRAKTNMPSFASNLNTSFEDPIIEIEGDVSINWEIHPKQLHITILPNVTN